MMTKPVTAIFDIGKTNKKFFLFDEDLQELHHEYFKLPLATDDDGFECDDIYVLSNWIQSTVRKITSSGEYQLKRLNFSTYGATLVHLGEDGKPVTPLYNYLKPFPEELVKKFYSKYPESEHNLFTASPSLGMLNSGLQLYWLKYTKPELFKQVKYTLHFPQYLSYLFTGKLVSEPTSIGCHTKLWDFALNQYHAWVRDEHLEHLLPEIVPATTTFQAFIGGHAVEVGVGVHDSSSALAAYMMRTHEPFALISTGTWSITLNPFTTERLTADELDRDCLNYLTIQGKPVKASRLFLGHELDHHLQILNTIFQKEARYYKQIKLDPSFMEKVEEGKMKSTFYPSTLNNPLLVQDIFPENNWRPEKFTTYEEAYHHVIWGLTQLQVASTKLALGKSSVTKIYIDGGFIDNEIFIKLIQFYLPEYTIEVSHMPLGSAHGAAMIMQPGKKQNTSGLNKLAASIL
jgi:sugar (pentulose or hexulose) kinase